MPAAMLFIDDWLPVAGDESILPESPGIARNLPESPGTQTDWVVEEVGGGGEEGGKEREIRGGWMGMIL